ncbi:MAG: hypothetical protein HYY06_08315 [Deltaproteobacteria bacterium]|nr:hypothetical protein [Deltaproteobacteria bacterium]
MRRLVGVLVVNGGLSSGGVAAADVTPGAPLRGTVGGDGRAPVKAAHSRPPTAALNDGRAG